MSRTRTRQTVYDNGGIQNITGKRYNGSNPVTNLSASTVYNSDKMDESVTDTVTPNFRRLMADGQIINNYYLKSSIIMNEPKPTSYQRAQLTISNGKVYGDTWNGSWPMGSSSLGGFIIPSEDGEFNSLVSSLISRAVTDAYANTSLAKATLLTSAAEYGKTIDSLFSIFVRAIRMFKSVRRLELAQAREALKGYLVTGKARERAKDRAFIKKQKSAKELSDRYMELRYALRPLAIDAANIVDALKTELENGARITGRGGAQDSWSKSNDFTINDGNFIMTINRKADVSTSVRAGVLCSCDVTNAAVFGIDQIPQTAWEIVPFSFILDWFWNIGNTIAAHTPNLGVAKLASWYTVKHTVVLENSLGSITNSVHTNHQDSITWSGKKTKVEVWTERVVNPTPSVFPSMNIRLDSLKFLDLAKILSNLRQPVRL